MRNIYWRPKNVSRKALGLIAIVALATVFVAENFKHMSKRPYSEEKLAAAQLAAEAFSVIKNFRSDAGAIDPNTDPAESGLIGFASSPVTSKHGGYLSKRTSINPNFAAVVVEMLKEAGVKEGDSVAVSMSGSFPALNICAHAAMQTLNAQPIIVASAASSEWGANDPDFMWLDMERILVEEGVFKERSVAASIGGLEGTGKGLSDESIALIQDCIERNEVTFLAPEDMADGVAKRVKLYAEKSGQRRIKAYVNVGGGIVATGGKATKRGFRPGLNHRAPPDSDPATSVMVNFVRRGVPVIHLVGMKELAQRHGLPLVPATVPDPGEGGVFSSLTYNRPLAVGLLLLVIGALYAFIRSPWGAQFLRPTGTHKGGDDIEPMI